MWTASTDSGGANTGTKAVGWLRTEAAFIAWRNVTVVATGFFHSRRGRAVPSSAISVDLDIDLSGLVIPVNDTASFRNKPDAISVNCSQSGVVPGASARIP